MNNFLEPYHQTYAYDTGNNLTTLSHQAKSYVWQQTIDIHSNNNRGTETQLSATDFDANGNLLTLNNIGYLDWHYNNSLNKLTKDDKTNTTEYYVYDHQGNRVRTVIESNKQIQNQRDYLPSLDISSDETKQPSNTLHIGTHILSETNKDNTQTRYQLSSHLQSNTLELNDKAQIISYEHYYPYGGTAIIAGKDRTQVQQKRYRYTGKERDDSSGLSYYGARYLAPWMTRWISPDSAGTIDGLNLYVYVRNNPLKYTDPTGHVKVNKDGAFYELDILTAISTTHQSHNLLHSAGAYQRLEETVKIFSINRPDEYQLLDTEVEFTVNPLFFDKETVQASFRKRGSIFKNTMNFETGELKFCINSRAPDFSISATEMNSYQYLGMTKIANAHNQLPRTFVISTITNIKAQSVMQAYRKDQDYIKFFNEFGNETDVGRSATRTADAFGLKITAIGLNRNDVRLHLLPQEVLRPLGESIILPPRKT